MNESDIVKEVARRTSLPEDTAAAVLHAMRDLVDEGVVDATALSTALPPPDAKPDDAARRRLQKEQQPKEENPK
jgi:hypothetical protein